MTREQKITECNKIHKRIDDIKEFVSHIKHDFTTSDRNKFLLGFVEIKKTISLLGVVLHEKSFDITIPSEIKLEIVAICDKWVKDLEKQANSIIPENDGIQSR